MKAFLPTVKNMLSAYLNQYFDLVFGTADNAIRAFVEHSSRDEVSRATEELRIILAMPLSEHDQQTFILDELGSCYYYPSEWPSAELWLRHLLFMLDG